MLNTFYQALTTLYHFPLLITSPSVLIISHFPFHLHGLHSIPRRFINVPRACYKKVMTASITLSLKRITIVLSALILCTAISKLLILDWFLQAQQGITRDAEHALRTKIHPLDAWEISWQNYNALATSPFGEVLPHILNSMDQWQNPPNCSTTNFFVLNYKTSNGFGAHVVDWLKFFHLAVTNGRVFLFNDEQNQFWSQGCKDPILDGKHECFFRSMSRTCSFQHIKKLVHKNVLQRHDVDGSSTLDEEGLPIVPTVQTGSPSAVFFNQPDILPAKWYKLLSRFSREKHFPEILHALSGFQGPNSCFETIFSPYIKRSTDMDDKFSLLHYPFECKNSTTCQKQVRRDTRNK